MVMLLWLWYLSVEIFEFMEPWPAHDSWQEEERAETGNADSDGLYMTGSDGDMHVHDGAVSIRRDGATTS